MYSSWLVLFSLVALALSGDFALAQPRWEEITSAEAGYGREGHAMAYDSHRNVVVMFGGRRPDVYHYSNTYQWDGTQWTLISNTGPAPRYGHAMVYDAARKEIVLFGGASYVANPTEDVYYADTWIWNGTSWKRVGNYGPPERHYHAMVYDSQRRVVVLYGGMAWGSIVYGDVWEWDGDYWTKIGDYDKPGPVPRYGHAMAYDSDRNVVVMQGGRHANLNLSPSTWEWSGSYWTLRASGGPARRCRHAMVYDSNRKRAVVFGGWEDDVNYNDTWEWDGSSWTTPVLASPASKPSQRRSHAMAFDTANCKVVLFGGSRNANSFYEFHSAYKDTWLYGPPTVITKAFDLFFKRVKSLPKTLTTGSQVRLTARMRNMGNTDSDAYTVYFYFSPDKTIDTTDVLMGSMELPALKMKKSRRIMKIALVPPILGKGDYYTIAKVVVADGNAGNNVKSSIKVVTVE